MKYWRATLAGALAIGLAGAGALMAQPPRQGRGGPGRDGFGIGRAARYLELTDEQRAQLRELGEQNQPARQERHQRMRDAQERFREALESANPDPTAVGQAAIEMHALRAEVEAEREAFETQLKSLLTEEQLRKWEMLEASRAAGPGPGGPGPGHRRGPRPE